MELLAKTIAVYAIPMIFAITLHEAAHGFVAKYFGDPTAYRLGRVSLNPLRHIDPVGTILVPLLILMTSKMMGGAGFLFGWAKPVPVNYYALRKPKEHMLWVAAAGPGSNLVQALLWAILLKVVVSVPEGQFSEFLAQIGQAGIVVNIVLMVLNLIPILPLDGGRIALSLMPDRLARSYARLEPYGLPILLLILVADAQFRILGPLFEGATDVVFGLFRFS